ncbi:hypothetical protein [Methanobrevibacter sp.]|uniref:hypothetical protein n=1 Tax=Methanobrevibacter sp. TaxID=66852 RepID=UPI00386D1F9C
MAVKIQLSIQEILNDFEKLVRWDERLEVHFENQSADDEDIEKFFKFVEEMALKYLPSYEEHMPPEFFSDDTSDYDKALELYKPLYENFKEIIYQLI